MELITTYLAHSFIVTKGKVILAFLVGAFWVAVGGFDVMKQALMVLLIIDFILGFFIAWTTHTLSKKRMQLGLIKLVSYSMALIVFNYMSIAIGGINIGGFGIMEFGIAYLALNEGLSALRHLGKLGVPIPIGIINKLEDYKDSLEMKDLIGKKK